MLPRNEDWRNATILVVEDSLAVRKMVCAMLTQTGYNCLEAGDGAEALRLLKEAEDVQLVLTDVIMPNMDGPELAHQLSQIRPDLRILFMSGYVEDAVVRSIGRTSSLFLSKPFTAAALMEKVRQALDRPWLGMPKDRAGIRSA
ncbi:MAG TPA: response regulator [Bryobacteraceae bacterium]|jgi:two-component system cell cycle sensor histidine kinase/response regulator CckA|nr:response regulator [Bryobacteraceae bacterium]